MIQNTIKGHSKVKRRKMNLDPKTRPLSGYLEELNECAEPVFGSLAQQMEDSLLNAKLPLHLKRSSNLAYLETGTYDQKVAHLGNELKLGGLETDEKLPNTTMATLTTTTAKQNQPQNTEQYQMI